MQETMNGLDSNLINVKVNTGRNSDNEEADAMYYDRPERI